MATLGPKESFYLELVREAWGPLTARREVRQALWVLVIGLFCVAGGAYATLVAADFTPFIAGLGFVAWSVSTLWPYREAVRAWWRVGRVHCEFAEGGLVAGEVGTIEFVVVPRRRGTVAAASLTIRAKDSRGPAAVVPWHQGLTFDAAVPSPADLDADVEGRLPVLVALDPAAPPSRFEQGWTRQWWATASLQFTDGRTWTREYPVLVYPGVAATSAMPGSATPPSSPATA